jgi:hypothetical protein
MIAKDKSYFAKIAPETLAGAIECGKTDSLIANVLIL